MILLGLAACGDGPTASPEPDDQGPRFPTCDLPKEFLFAPAARELVPSLDDPSWTWLGESPDPEYLRDNDRVIGISAFGFSWAVPHNVLWYHEIVNFEPGGPNGPALAVTYCPLTGSSLVCDRQSVNRATLGVSGFVFMNNLMMYDRQDPEDTLWSQMMADVRCGTRSGSRVSQWPFVEMEWEEWRSLHPDTYILGGAEAQGFDPVRFDYTARGYPYGTYREIESFFFGNLMPFVDTRRFPKERVVGIPSTSSDPGIAFPFDALESGEGGFRVVEFLYEGRSGVVLWSDRGQGGSAYRPVTEEGDAVTLRSVRSGFADDETGSLWTGGTGCFRPPRGTEPRAPRRCPHGFLGCLGHLPSRHASLGRLS